MTIGIASLWFNHTELLPDFERLMGKSEWDRLILVDNASTLESHAAYQEAISRLGRRASVLRMEANSVLHGWNAGMAALGTDIVIQMGNDVLMTDPHWLEWGVEGIHRGIIQGPICWQRANVAYIDGCMCVATRDTWGALGGLDSQYYVHPGYWSDIDLCWRAQMMGMMIRATRCGIHHISHVTSGTEDAPEFQEHARRNMGSFLNRYIGPMMNAYPVRNIEDLGFNRY